MGPKPNPRFTMCWLWLRTKVCGGVRTIQREFSWDAGGDVVCCGGLDPVWLRVQTMAWSEELFHAKQRVTKMPSMLLLLGPVHRSGLSPVAFEGFLELSV
jgi:hypothetical protein